MIRNQQSPQIKNTSFTKLGAILPGILFSAIISLFIGCYSTPLSYEKDPEVWASSINVNQDESTGAKLLVGPGLVTGSSWRREVHFNLEGFISEQNDPLTRVVVTHFGIYTGYESAISDGGKHWDMEVLSRGSVDVKSFNSNPNYDLSPRKQSKVIVTIEIPLEYMREKEGSGFSFELKDRWDTQIVEKQSVPKLL